MKLRTVLKTKNSKIQSTERTMNLEDFSEKKPRFEKYESKVSMSNWKITPIDIMRESVTN